MMKLLAVDYDGVLVDSTAETFIIAHNTYLKLYKKDEYENKKIELKNFDAQKWKEQLDKFTRLRAFVTYAGQFGITTIELMNKEINNQDDFEDAIKNSTIEQNHFKEQFHSSRREILKNNFNEWLKLTPPFKIVLDSVKKLVKDNKVVILTGNDSFVVQKYLSFYGISIDKEDIYDSYVGKSKKEKMEMIGKRFDADFNDIVVVDDTLKQILELKSLGVKCFMAVWGYNNEEQRKEAEEKGIELLKEEEFYERIKGAYLNLSVL